jgi:anion-transporting  ArsA/GET3 family ATPase
MNARTLEHGLRESRVLVCAGTGGVGKTTIAAALAIAAARLGRRSLVLTIDPARRLADALGLEELGSTPTPVNLSALNEPGSASLDAMMLDAKPTFDRLIRRLTPVESERRRILDNRIYQHLSSALAGSAEYAAMEQVHELVESTHYDLIVVDTPPADHALDFLRTPRRLREFLGSRFVATLVRPAMSASRIGLRLFARPLHRMLGLVERIAGVGFLDDLSEFLSAIDGLSKGFQDRASRVEEVLLGDGTGFVLISSAKDGSNKSTLDFIAELDAFRVPLIALIVNRMHPWPLDSTPRDLLDRCDPEALARDCERLVAAHAANHRLADTPPDFDNASESVLEIARICENERQSVETLTTGSSTSHLQCWTIPELPGDIDQIDGLLAIGSILRGETDRDAP